jgi:hypothetical protein
MKKKGLTVRRVMVLPVAIPGKICLCNPIQHKQTPQACQSWRGDPPTHTFFCFLLGCHLGGRGGGDPRNFTEKNFQSSNMALNTLKKRRINFFSYLRKFRWEHCKVIYEEGLPNV